jgi:hypothetical protein
MDEQRREIPEPTPHWPGGLTAYDDPTPIESALAALNSAPSSPRASRSFFFYLSTYGGLVAPRAGATLAVVAAFVGPSVIAFLRTAWVRRRRRTRVP